jgi:predicted short-subunit dehydrogenase-like oxidoreductase (DUF2520 family)
MSDNAAPKIVIIGCGNVSWHLASKFRDLKFNVTVYNHRANPALEDFQRKLKCTARVGLHNIEKDAAFYFICVPDRYIGDCAKMIAPMSPRAVTVHTSGSVELSELGKRGHGTAVFYPLQTFSVKDEVNWQKVPVLVEADSDQTTEQVVKLAEHMTKTVKVLPFEERIRFHLAAVLVNNFTNALFAAASDLVADKSGERKFDLLIPLISQTVEKVKKMDPLTAQTGPAKRGDKKVIKKHMKLLEEQPVLRKLYKEMSGLIAGQHDS